MPFDPTGARAIAPVSRIQPIYGDDIGDRTAGGSNTVQDFLDARRRYRGTVANLVSRPSTSLADGDWIIVLDAGSGTPELHVYLASDTDWYPIMGAGTGAGAMSTPVVVLADADTDNAVYTLPYAGGFEFVWKSGAIQVQGGDYTRAGTKITFVPGNVPDPLIDYVVISASRATIDSDADSVGGAVPSVTSAANALVKTTVGGVIDPSMLPDPDRYGSLGTLQETSVISTDGTLASVVWKDGPTTIKTMNLTYNADGTIATRVYVVAGYTITHTYTYTTTSIVIDKAVT